MRPPGKVPTPISQLWKELEGLLSPEKFKEVRETYKSRVKTYPKELKAEKEKAQESEQQLDPSLKQESWIND
jgi:Skp family chaperone for outer membrane proteins